MNQINIQPRVLRLRDAPLYLGMDIHRFNHEVRPQLGEINIGKQGVAFDRLDLDAWFEVYKLSHARPATDRREKLWERSKFQGSRNAGAFGKLTKLSDESAFAKALAQATLKKQSVI